MDAKRFDCFSRALAPAASRRTTLGVLLGGLGLVIALESTDAKKKRKKKNKRGKDNKGDTGIPPLTCTGCTACETCVNGTCQLVADGTTCGTGRICVHGACAKACTSGGNECPAGQLCDKVAGTLAPTFCIPSAEAECSQPSCSGNASCARGSICGIRGCGTGIVRQVCIAVPQA